MSSIDKKIRTLLIIEDDEEYIEILKELYQEALAPLRLFEKSDIDSAMTSESVREAVETTDVYLTIAKTPEAARKILRERDVYLATVDINLSNAPRGTASEGMEILEEMQNLYPNTCAIIVSAEDPGLHMQQALRRLGAVDFFQKDNLGKKEAEFKNLLKNTMIYAEAVRLFKVRKQWASAEQSWISLIKAFPDFENNDVKGLGKLLEKKRSDITELPGQEWIQQELKLLKNTPLLDWAIIIVELDNFKPFQDRDFSEGADVLKEMAQALRDIQKEAGATPLVLVDLFRRLLKQADRKESLANIFLGEVDNTGRFIFVTPSRQIATRVKELIDNRLTKDAFQAHYRLIPDNKGKPKQEYELGYFLSQGRQVSLLQVSTKMITSDDIKNIPSDVKEFMEQIF